MVLTVVMTFYLLSCDDAEYDLNNPFDPANMDLDPPALFFHPFEISADLGSPISQNHLQNHLQNHVKIIPKSIPNRADSSQNHFKIIVKSFKNQGKRFGPGQCLSSISTPLRSKNMIFCEICAECRGASF